MSVEPVISTLRQASEVKRTYAPEPKAVRSSRRCCLSCSVVLNFMRHQAIILKNFKIKFNPPPIINRAIPVHSAKLARPNVHLARPLTNEASFPKLAMDRIPL